LSLKSRQLYDLLLAPFADWILPDRILVFGRVGGSPARTARDIESLGRRRGQKSILIARRLIVEMP
jgi:hypothetical protein